MLTVTLDTNILVDLERQAPRTAPVRRLIDHPNVRVHLPAIIASERQPGGAYLDDFGMFVQRAANVGISEDSLVSPVGWWGITFWQRCLWSSDESTARERAIHAILFEQRPYECPDGLGSEFKANVPHPDYLAWRNAKCDVLMMWCHLHYQGDVFITSDANFHKATKKARLLALGARQIVRPDDPALLRDL